MKKMLITYACGLGMLMHAATPGVSQVPTYPVLEKVNHPKSGPDTTNSRLSPELWRLVTSSKNNDETTLTKSGKGITIGTDNLLQIINGKVVVNAIVSGSLADARSQLEESGATITGTYGRVISALVPIESLPLLENATQLRYTRAAYKPRHQGKFVHQAAEVNYKSFSTPSIHSQGDTAQGSYLARKKYKSDGTGVKVAIISDSYNNRGGAETGVTNGELPGPQNPNNYKKPVTVHLDHNCCGFDEGRAMAEIIHDVAPGAELGFVTGAFGAAPFASAFGILADLGYKVIVDDIFHIDEPYFQDGIIAQAIDKAAMKGVACFTSAGNASAQSYESVFRPSNYEMLGPGYGTAHNFAASGATPIYFQPVLVPAGGVFTVALQWDEPFFSAGGDGAQSDIDIYIFDVKGNIAGSSTSDNIYIGDPIEIAFAGNDGTNNTFFISILKKSGRNPSRLKYILYDDASFYSGSQIPGQNASTVVGHANSAGAITTAAVPYWSTPAYGVRIPLVEAFSSLGGTRILFDKEGKRISPEIRRKPEITAPDGGNNSFFGVDDATDSDIFPNLYGTSAAAPHAAGVAALMIHAQKLNTLTPSQIRGIMAAKTYDMDNIYSPGFDKGFDFLTGSGLIRAELAVGEVKFPNLYIRNLELVSVCSDDPSKTRNWKIINNNSFEVKVHWFLTGFSQSNNLTAPPGVTFFSTRTAYYQNRTVPNIVILDWEDNFGFTRFDIAAAANNNCKNNNDLAGTQTLGAEEQALLVKENSIKPEIADVFPNPSRSQFKLYLSLNKTGKTELSLFSEDGKVVYRNNVSGNGIYDIDASRFKSGLYVLKITQGSFSKTLKLIKQ
jgi:hypothetical protein